MPEGITKCRPLRRYRVLGHPRLFAIGWVLGFLLLIGSLYVARPKENPVSGSSPAILILRDDRLPEGAADNLDRRLSEIAQSGTDCGRVNVRQNPKGASDCAVKAFHAHQPFRVRFDLQGIDSSVAVGFAGTEQGDVIAFFFDGDPAGKEGTSATRQSVSGRKCPKPVTLFKSPEGRLECFPPDPHAKPTVMSPTFQAY